MAAEPNPLVTAAQLPEAALFDLQEEVRDDLLERLLLTVKVEGMGLLAPATVDVGQHKRLPLLWLLRTSGRRSWEVQLVRNSALVAVDLSSGAVTVRHAFAGPKLPALAQLPVSRDGAVPERAQAASTRVDTRTLDARQIAKLPWRPGRMALTLLSYDWRTNTVLTELTGPPPGPAGPVGVPRPEVLEVAEANRAALRSAEAALRVERSEATPAGNEGPGAWMRVPPEAGAGANRIVVHGLARVAVPGAALLAGRPPEPEARESIPGAVLTLTVLVGGLDRPEPSQVVVRAPIFAKRVLKAGQLVEAAFSLDLQATLRQPLQPSEHPYQLWLVAGEHVGGPWPLTLQP